MFREVRQKYLTVAHLSGRFSLGVFYHHCRGKSKEKHHFKDN